MRPDFKTTIDMVIVPSHAGTYKLYLAGVETNISVSASCATEARALVSEALINRLGLGIGSVSDGD
jgi:hypothetical protein